MKLIFDISDFYQLFKIKLNVFFQAMPIETTHFTSEQPQLCNGETNFRTLNSEECVARMIWQCCTMPHVFCFGALIQAKPKSCRTIRGGSYVYGHI